MMKFVYGLLVILLLTGCANKQPNTDAQYEKDWAEVDKQQEQEKQSREDNAIKEDKDTLVDTLSKMDGIVDSLDVCLIPQTVRPSNVPKNRRWIVRSSTQE